jgi:asparagine synthase (glutamine-hydrolysing)
MTRTIAHRGPDDSGTWIDPAAGVALGHRRLSVLDLSPAGHQPMVSSSRRYTIVYNGEIYNYRDLRAEIEAAGGAPSWRGHSDTEVMLAAFDHWGVPGTLERLNGMFAFALWDSQRRVLILARDRMGEKPLYYGRMGKTFLFGSELKALTVHPDFEQQVNREALTLFLRYDYVPAPLSIWNGIFKLPAAHYLEVAEGGRLIGPPTCYWSLFDVASRGAADPLPDGAELLDDLETLLKDAVARRMEADVPVGAFLSGGVDSSLVVALMQAQSSSRVRTFTIGFDDPAYNEAGHAKAVADHLGTAHTELYVSAEDVLGVVPRLPQIWDEPFSDSSQIPTYLVSALTRQQVTVSLSGDGGDELFGGYTRYVAGIRLWSLASRLPESSRHALAALTRSRAGRGAARTMMKLASPSRQVLGLEDRLHKIGDAIEAGSADQLYRRLVSRFQEPSALVIGGGEPRGAAAPAVPDLPGVAEKMMYLDTLTYLPDDILAKLDRASMAVSLEGRIPFLDHRVVEFAWRLPISARIRNGQGKHVLRQLLYRHVPRPLLDRPKSGFGLPLSGWLAGPLRAWAEDLLDEARLRAEGFFDPIAVRRLWNEHVRHERRHQVLWNILMFQAWWAEHRGAAQEQPNLAPVAAAHG